MLGVCDLRDNDLPISIYNVFANLFGEMIGVLRLPMLDLGGENRVIHIEQDHTFRVLRIIRLPSRQHTFVDAVAVSGGRLMMLSTPFGKRGVFWEEWTGGEGWERYEVRAEECERIPAGFLEEERQALPAWIYRQEYECSFEDTEDQLFGYELVTSSITDEITPLFGEAS